MTNFNNLAPVKETTIKGDDFLIFDSLEFRNQSTNNEQITKWTTTRGGDRKSIDYILTIVIHLYTQPLNNLPVKRYEIIFRHVREDFIDITTRAYASENSLHGVEFKKLVLHVHKKGKQNTNNLVLSVHKKETKKTNTTFWWY